MEVGEVVVDARCLLWVVERVELVVLVVGAELDFNEVFKSSFRCSALATKDKTRVRIRFLRVWC